MATKKSNTRGGRVVLFLFGTPFAAVGIGMLVLAVIPNIYDWVRMHSWVPVQAQLLTSQLKSHYNDKTTTYQVIAQYRYQYQGRVYTGTRVGISEKSDNIGDWHQRTYNRLHSMQPLRVWVNPSNPREAIFDRELRWAKLGFYMIFVLVFGGAGIGIIWYALRKPVQIPEGVPLWQGNPAWRDNRIRSNAKFGMWFIWAFAAVWNLISSPLFFAIPAALAKGNHAIIIALLFPVVGLGLLIYALKMTLEWRRFGPTPLQLDPFPGAVGGDVGGSISINQILPRDAIAMIELSCVYVYSSGGGKNRSTVREVKWQDQQHVRVEAGYQGSLIKFKFETPEGLPASEEKIMPYYEWTLEVQCQLPGTDLNRTFEIPVFPDAASKHSGIQPLPAENPSGLPIINASIVRMSQTAQGLRLYYPLFRAFGVSLIFTVVGGLFVAMSWVFVFGHMRPPPPMIFPIVFGTLGMLAFLSGLYGLGNSLTVLVNGNGIDITRRVYGIPFRRNIPLSAIQSINIDKGVQTARGTNSVLNYRVKVLTRSGKKLTVAELLPGMSTAKAMLAQIKSACGLRS